LSISLWRISKRKFADTAFSGEGARRVGGRWNSRGTGMVYTSATLSLAALEVFVHMEIEDARTMLTCIRADVPTSVKIERVEVGHLPLNWRDLPAPQALAEIGDRWFVARESAILAVPSVVIPSENNYLVNPHHPDFAKFEIRAPEVFELDPRLWKVESESR
jgi:RES domain-containing protein